MPIGCAEGSVCFSQFTQDIWQSETGEEVSGVGDLTTPGGIISAVWPFAFGIAGLILFGMLVWGALEIQFGAATPGSAEKGKKRITHAVVGFILLFMVFWMGQLLQQIFGLNFGVGTNVGFNAPLDNSGSNGGSGSGGSGGNEEEETAQVQSYVAENDGMIYVCTLSDQPYANNATGTLTINRGGEQLESDGFTLALLPSPAGNAGYTQCGQFNIRQYAIEHSTSDLLEQVNTINSADWTITGGAQSANVYNYNLLPNTSGYTTEQAEAVNAAINDLPDYQLYFSINIPGQNLAPIRVYINHNAG